MTRELVVTGFGDVSERHFESGLVLAHEYFSRNNLDYLECFKAYEIDQCSPLGEHWLKAEQFINKALYADNLQDNSMLELSIE